MKRLILICLLFLFWAGVASAQLNPDEYFLNNDSRSDEPFVAPEFGVELMLDPQPGGDVFSEISRFGFSSVRYLHRGLEERFNRTYVDNIDIGGLISSVPDYRLLYNLRHLKTSFHTASAFAGSAGYVPGAGKTDMHSTDIGERVNSTTVSLFGYNRKGRLGGRYTGFYSGKKVSVGVTATRRWGRDAFTDGVFTDEITGAAIVNYRIAARHNITFTLNASRTEDGVRTYATREAFELTGSNFYNPSWGYFEGKVRNTKVSKDFRPSALIAYNARVGRGTSISATVYGRTGKYSRSALSWFNARSPLPDYYRYMPSWAETLGAAEEMSGLWQQNALHVTQINWNELLLQNSMATEGVVYMLENRVEEVSDVRCAFSGHTFLGQGALLVYGADYSYSGSRYYKTAKDLLGGKPFADIDQYLYEDELYGDRINNNLLTPGRLVGDGERFGYDYLLAVNRYRVHVGLRYNYYGLEILPHVEVGKQDVQREGYYEKELYPGNLSYGRSRRPSFSTYTASVGVRYSFTFRHMVAASFRSGRNAPMPGNVFISPEYTNVLTEGQPTTGSLSVEAAYRMTLDAVRMQANVYYTSTRSESAVYRYYDDISSVYSDMVVRGIDKEHYGFELGVVVKVAPRLELTAAGAINRYVYFSDPSVDIYEDASLMKYVHGATSYLNGFRVGGTPESTGMLELKYNNRGWIASATCTFYGGRYVTPNPLRRMERAFSVVSSAEAANEFVSQEKLPATTVAGLFVLKSFFMKSGTLTLLASVDNLFDKRDMVYNAYEQMRVAKRGTGINRTYSAFPSKYLYSYGRNYYVSVSYKF